MNLKEFKLVSWDLDGTLYPIRSLYFQIYRELLKASIKGTGIQALHELAEIRSFQKEFRRRSSASVRTQEILAGLNRPHIRDLEEKWFGTALRNIKPTAKVHQTLRKASELGISQVVLSNFMGAYKLRALGLEEYFQCFWACEEMEEFKPSPVPFRILQNHYGISPSEHLHIGDRFDTDGLGVERAGGKFVHIVSIQSLTDHI